MSGLWLLRGRRRGPRSPDPLAGFGRLTAPPEDPYLPNGMPRLITARLNQPKEEPMMTNRETALVHLAELDSLTTLGAAERAELAARANAEATLDVADAVRDLTDLLRAAQLGTLAKVVANTRWRT